MNGSHIHHVKSMMYLAASSWFRAPNIASLQDLMLPLKMCEIKFDMFNDDNDEAFIDHWISNVQWLLLTIFNDKDDETPWFPLPELLLFSSYLIRLDLYGIRLSARFAHFSSYPAQQRPGG